MVLLQSLLAAVHLTIVGLAAVGPLLVAVLRLSGRGRQDVADASALDSVLRRVARWSTASVVAGALVGIVAGTWRVWADDGEYYAMLARFPKHAYGMLAVEWLFTLACYGAWLALWKRWQEKPWWHAVLAVVGATNLLYHFPPLMVAHNLIAEQPELVSPPVITRKLALEVMLLPQVAAKTTHFWGASVVVTATALAVASRRLKADRPREVLVRWSAVVGFCGTTAQFLSGLATLLLIDGAETRNLTGGSPGATGLLVLGVILSILLLLLWARIALRPTTQLPITGLAATVAGIMLSMSLAARL